MLENSVLGEKTIRELLKEKYRIKVSRVERINRG